MKVFIPITLLVIVLAGCGPRVQKPVWIYPSKVSLDEVLAALRSRSEKVGPFKASGQCLLEYYIEGKKHRENFPVKLWVNPPTEIYLQGDVAFDPRAIVLGANKNEFWLAIKPKEISSYWWGRWSKGSYPEKLMISPKIVLEALGIAAVGSDETNGVNWTLSKEGSFDVLTKRGDTGRIIKKIYIHNRDYLVKRIEYFDVIGRAVVVVELNKYRWVIADFFAPKSIKITKRAGRSQEDSVTITLGSVKSVKFTEKLRERLFTRPEPRGFKYIYKIVDDDIIEQPQ